MNPTFFKNVKELREWLKKNHQTKKEFWLGFYKTKSPKFNYSWSEAVDELLCFGWIDGLKKSIDEESYMHRITPRKLNSHWCKINIDKVEKLKLEGRMFPKGLELYNNRKQTKQNQYSFENNHIELDNSFLKIFKTNKTAFTFYNNLAPSVKKQSVWWVMSAKRQETRNKRFQVLLESSNKQQKIPPLNWSRKKPQK